MDDSPRPSMKERVLARIEQGDVKVRPKAIAVAKMSALIVLVGFALLISVFLFNFLFFFLRVNHFGPLIPGQFERHADVPFDVLRFVLLFPWRLLALDIALIVLAEILLRQFRFAYRRPVLYVLFALLALTISLGLFIDRVTDFNEQMEGHMHHGRLPPPIDGMYRHARY